MKTYDIELFKELDKPLQDEISRYAKLVEFKKKSHLFCKDELLCFFYIIISGKMKTYQLNLDNAKEQTIFILRAGDMVDTIVLLDSKPHDVMHEALDDMQMLQFPIERVRGWIRENRAFSQNFFSYLASQMRHIEELATDISLHNTSQRLIKLLLHNIDPDNRQEYNIIHGLSHSEIAKLTGTVRNVVERHLHQLKDEGILEIRHKNLLIKNTKKLLARLR